MMTKNSLHQKANEMVDMFNNPIYPFIREHSFDKDEYPGGLEIKTEQDKIELNEIKSNNYFLKLENKGWCY